ncbi:unnamed protein product [Didymodactylos carnosus]|uniref:Cytochrome P450 n=1 Tax=Didymodactylos carnosus TaxID=1234261 RepID=A0A815WS54_9BILA|nr:unnamed protein product [Didymodactylos carnosus]CAF4413971.1 unnamed protein product [Didymodactylos carnosus]
MQRESLPSNVLLRTAVELMAGHETTSNLMTWTLYHLTTNPNVYCQCQQEIDTILKGQLPTSETLSKLVYTEAVLKESLRLHPPVANIVRTAIEDNTIIDQNGKQIHIKKGTDILLNFFMLHHSEKYWTNPWTFDPRRFLDGTLEPSIFLPFSAGPRSCIGQNFAMLEAKIMLSMIVQRFDLEFVEGQKIVPDVTITMRPKYGLFMRIKLRNQAECIP